MQKNNYKFFNIPAKRKKEDYTYCIRHLIRKYSRTQGLNAIYEWGDVSQPGISDLDIIFVFDSNAKPLPFLKRSFLFNNSKVRYLARHPFIFIDRGSFRKIKYIYHDTDLKLLYGAKVDVLSLRKNEEYHSKISLLNDLIIRHYPRDFFGQQLNRAINIRDTMLRLNSIKYTVMTFSGIAKERDRQWDHFTKNVGELREGWFENKNYDSLIKLNGEAIRISMDITGRFRRFLLKKGLVRIISGNEAEYSGIKNKSVFVRDWNPKNALDKMAIMAKNGKYCSVLPLELYPQLVEYSKYKGRISSYIRKNLASKVDYKLKHKNIMGKRIKILNNQALLAHKLRHSDFAAFFDFGYRSKSGINNLMLNLMDKIRF